MVEDKVEELASEIFDVLKHNGPMDASQISVELLVGLDESGKKVYYKAIDELMEEGYLQWYSLEKETGIPLSSNDPYQNRVWYITVNGMRRY